MMELKKRSPEDRMKYYEDLTAKHISELAEKDRIIEEMAKDLTLEGYWCDETKEKIIEWYTAKAREVKP
jgi:hypothetical protein